MDNQCQYTLIHISLAATILNTGNSLSGLGGNNNTGNLSLAQQIAAAGTSAQQQLQGATSTAVAGVGVNAVASPPPGFGGIFDTNIKPPSWLLSGTISVFCCFTKHR